MNFIKFLEYFFKKYLPNEGFCDRIIFVSGDGGMADALDSGSSGSNPVRVQVPFSALNVNPESFKNKGIRDFFFALNIKMGQKWGNSK